MLPFQASPNASIANQRDDINNGANNKIYKSDMWTHGVNYKTACCTEKKG